MAFSKQIADRMKNMLVRDKMGVGDGFIEVFKTDLKRLICDYFDLDGDIDVKVELKDNGKYQVDLSYTATNTRGFCSTADMKKGIY